MIHYQLRCDQAHGFDGWFRDSATFEKQAATGLIECPECGGRKVDRALMAPAVSKRDVAARQEVVPVPEAPPAQEILPPDRSEKLAGGRLPAQMLAVLQKIRAEVEKKCDYVGPAFAEEARKMHHGDAEPRAIYGETTPEQAESLAEDGIEVTAIPWVPRADG